MTEQVFGIHVTTRCTLKCKLCSGAWPYHPAKDEDIALIKAELYEVFRLYEYIGELRLGGAEPFLHPNICEIIDECSKYKKQFGRVLIITNATYILRQNIIKMLSTLDYHYMVRVDDYGAHSHKLKELKNQLENAQISFEIRHYNEDNQYCGGWVDMGNDFSLRNIEDSRILDVFQRCHAKTDCKYAYDGKLWGCAFAASGTVLSKIPLCANDYIDLLSVESIENKREALRTLGTYPFEGCKYCRGHDPNDSERFPAAEQI
jgi:hypothetical protein